MRLSHDNSELLIEWRGGVGGIADLAGDDRIKIATTAVARCSLRGRLSVSSGRPRRLLTEKPQATGLAVPGMPVGSPGMEGDRPEKYDVVLFGRDGRRTYMRFYWRTERLI
jgi:uncharacterized protein DUF411